MSEKFILALDQGTTSSRAIVFDRAGRIKSSASFEFRQIYPRPGWVEHSPDDIWNSQLNAALEALKKGSLKASDIAAIGIANQRETIILWDRASGKPVFNAIVWQCRRSSEICAELEKKSLAGLIRLKTGLLPDPYFSASKIKWIFNNVPGVYEKALLGGICAGTVDSWLLYKLTGKHLTDFTNASRTMLFNIGTCKWDKELLDIFGVPESVLPEVLPSSSFFGNAKTEIFGAEIPVRGAAGDQQASLFGQTCFEKGDTKNTYGTGCFMLTNTGTEQVLAPDKLISTIAWNLGGRTEYAVEGSVFVAGALVQWLRDELKIIKSAAEIEQLALSVKNNGGVFIVPAFSGLGAPYWDPSARGAILGLSRSSGAGHIARAALESIAFQSFELIESIRNNLNIEIKSLRVDGGASANNLLMQIQADMAGIPIIRSEISENTALGAAYLAGLNSGYWTSKEELRSLTQNRPPYIPASDVEERAALLKKWRLAVSAVRQFK